MKFRTLDGNSYVVTVKKASYGNGRPAILLESTNGVPFATATVNIVAEDIGADEAAIKDYSENAGMLSFLLDNNIVAPPHRHVNSGYVQNIPVCKILI